MNLSQAKCFAHDGNWCVISLSSEFMSAFHFISPHPAEKWESGLVDIGQLAKVNPAHWLENILVALTVLSIAPVVVYCWEEHL